MRKLIPIVMLALFASTAHAAVWERPAGGYTPTNHSVNITKYQIDRSNGTAISSVKVDGDINKAFQGLNSLESRVPPSVSGQGGKFLTNDGANTSWGLISPTAIGSGAAASGQVLIADGAGAAAFSLLTTTSFADLGVAGTYAAPTFTVNSAGMVTAITSTQTISATNAILSGSLVVSTTGAFGGSITAPAVSTSAILGAAGKYISKAWVNFDGTGSTGTAQTIRASANVSQVWKVSGATYSISFTNPMADANYTMGGSTISSNGIGYVGLDFFNANTASAARIITRNSGGLDDGKIVHVTFMGN